MTANFDTLPQELSLYLTDKISITFSLIPQGSFLMGSRGYDREQPVHRVTITKPFYLGIYPVTQAQFAVWTNVCGIDHNNSFPDKPNNPAESMDWMQAGNWCDWLMEASNQIPEGFRVRLPSEAEWEFACSSWCESSAGRIYSEYHTGDGDSAFEACLLKFVSFSKVCKVII